MNDIFLHCETTGACVIFPRSDMPSPQDVLPERGRRHSNDRVAGSGGGPPAPSSSGLKATPAAGTGCWPPPAGMVPLIGSVAGYSALELLSRRPDHHSNALVTNNNVSVPLALFGTSALDRVLVERIQLLANVGNGCELLDLGSFRINCSKSSTSNRMKVSTAARQSVSSWFHRARR